MTDGRTMGANGGSEPVAFGRRKEDRRGRVVRVAAVGDFHVGEKDGGEYREAFARVNDEADILLLAGDLTRRGTPAEIDVVIKELQDVRVPILAVLGNHDHESGQPEKVNEALRARGVHLLDEAPFELNEHVGFAGVKGYMGGFGRYTLTAFGEQDTKTFVGTTLDEVQKLEYSLRRLSTPVRVVLLHYAPIMDTVMGEPEQIFPFLGNDRLLEPIDRFKAAVVFHGHAHHGTFRGQTPGGVPVFNVSMLRVREDAGAELFYVHEIPLPADLPAAEQASEPGVEHPSGAERAAARSGSA
ncbi:metallophosphoesterase family protein [Longimicrobium sp.]|uniref:metallophosphoesterase family protein n=1 Tax=Longimicrobium sp. TaxID=2029185 RepID=UPI002E35AC7F|nr:metallophosphoesterase [Longimicrobium sp.]HEX6038724.1 metallophosphoesterase [Longimicrobium sp.]